MTEREPGHLYGFHDRGGEQFMINAGKPGWVLVTEKIGHDRNSTGGLSYSDLADKGLGVIVRLNNGYKPDGTVPKPEDYDDFAQRCAHFVKNSSGCHNWIIGNEMNHSQERPQGEPVTPDLYVQCYRKCRQAIHEQAGEEHRVIVGAVAPYNVETRYPGNEAGDWVRYFVDILEGLENDCDGIALHAYTWGSDPGMIASEERMDAPYDHRRKQFRVYQDFMEAIPESMRHLPVYITEANQGGAGAPWEDSNNGWIPRAYREIDEWNRRGGQQIRCLLLYRWSTADHWSISDKDGLIAGFRDALAGDYRWGYAVEEQPQVEGDARTMIQELRGVVAGLHRRVTRLEEQMAGLVTSKPPEVNRPPMAYVVHDLPRHSSEHYATRNLEEITHIVVHHSETEPTVTAEQMARYHVNAHGWPGIGYHFVIAADGTIQQTNELTSIAYHARQANRYSVGICFVGDFKEVVPPEAQLVSGGHLIAWLLQELHLPLERVGPHKAHVASTSCPGGQWDAGQRWGELLRAQIERAGTGGT